MPFFNKLDQWRAQAVDWVSFGAVNLLQRRHPPPANLRELWQDYLAQHDGATIEDYYAIPDNYVWPDWPSNNKWRFRTPLPGDLEKNNDAGFDLYPCAKGWSDRPTMIMAHGWMSVSDYGYRLWAQRLNACGWNAIFMHLPYHYSRRLPGHLHGEYAINAHLIRTAEGIRQAVMELRVLLTLLKEQGGTVLGGWGTSYGGWIMAMTACVDPLLQRLILVEPILNIQKAIWTSAAAVTLRLGLERCGLTPEDTRIPMQLCCPSYSQLHMEGRHALLLAGAYDSISPPEQIQALHHRWKGSHFYCFNQGHVGYTLMPKSFGLAQQHWPEDFSYGSQAAISTAL